MAAPDMPELPGAAPARGVVQSLLQSGRGRSTLLLGIFALVLFAAGRRTPDAASTPPVQGDSALAAAPRTLAVGRAPPSHLPEPTPEVIAVETLLARYDALIRLLEARSIDGRGPPADSALDELRALRGQTYAAARRAVAAGSAHPPDR